MSRETRKGFTLMEMLIVVAIISVLVVIAIPTFSSSLVKTKEAADKATVREAYAQAATNANLQLSNFPDTVPNGLNDSLNFSSNLHWNDTAYPKKIVYLCKDGTSLSLDISAYLSQTSDD